MDNYFAKYIEIRNSIDEVCNKLHNDHKNHTACSKGCDKCCMNFSILPVEFYSILDAIKTQQPKLNTSNPDKCIFLVDHECQIYEHRPAICRSHGLPILNMSEDGENMELSFCPLNFTDVEVDYFTMENGYQQDTFNSKLYMANLDFIKQSGKEISDNKLLEIRDLKKYL